MKKKEVKGICKKLIKSVKKALAANNKSLIDTLEKDIQKSISLVAVNKSTKRINMKKAAAVAA